MGVDKWGKLYYNKEAVEKLDTKLIGGILAHEIAHLIRFHWERLQLGTDNHVRANIAGDLEINDDILDGTDLKLPEDGCYPKKFGFKDGLLAEEYFILLEKHVKKIKMPSFGGSSADGQKREWEDGPSNTSISKEEMQALAKKVAEDIDKHPGNVPGGLKLWAKQVLNPRVNWEAQLRALVINSIQWVKGQYTPSYSTPSRRRHPEFILPGKISPNPNVVCIIDTSGSMYDIDQVLLSQCVAEVGGILRAIPSQCVKVVTGDTQSNFAAKIFNKNQIQLIGDGGTDMAAIMDEHKKCDIQIVLTDGYTPWPNEQRCKTIACVFSEEKVPGWIKTIRVK
jgi:predicted metal-dependent peptidase